MDPLPVALAHYRRQKELTVKATAAAAAWWAQVDPANVTGSWAQIGPAVAVVVGASQTLAAANADRYTSAILTAQSIDAPPEASVDPLAFSGIASDGRDLATLLAVPAYQTVQLLSQGLARDLAVRSGLKSLSRIVTTQVADAGRAATGTAAASRPAVRGWVRMVNPPACSRCVVLAGRFYRWSDGFERHPGDDCVNIPASENVAGDLRTDAMQLIRSGQVTGLSKADTKAILDDGADVSQVINAHRGMSTEQVFGQRLKVTTEGTTRRGLAGTRLGAVAPRLRPESIYKIAEDRADAIRLLKRNGYLI